MIDRRSAGVATLHTLLIGGEAVLLWIAIGSIVTAARSFETFTTLLPRPAYPVAIRRHGASPP